MALYIYTNSPQALLNKFNAAIFQSSAEGKITTWVYAPNTPYFTHVSAQWNKKAWFKAEIEVDKIKFNIFPSKGAILMVPVYGFYHGHLSETFLNHFDKDFSIAVAAALAGSGDGVG